MHNVTLISCSYFDRPFSFPSPSPSLQLVPQSSLMVIRAGMAASDGRSKVLDASADGYCRGEAVRALWLAPWSAKQREVSGALPGRGGV